MGLMDMMREFSAFKEDKEIEQMEEAVADADNTFLREELKKYVYKDEIVDELLPAMKVVYDHHPDMADKLLEVFKFKESEIENLVAHKSKFEEETSPDDKVEEEDQPDTTENLVDKILSDKYGE